MYKIFVCEIINCIFARCKFRQQYYKKMSKLQWFLFYTSPRAEKQVDKRLNEAGVESFLPLHYTARRWSDRVKMVEVPLFPSYVFVKTEDVKLRPLLQIPGVYRIVYYNDAPAVIRNSVIESVKKFIELAREKEITYDVGDEVLIAFGPMKDIAGKILRIRKDEYCLYVPELGYTVKISASNVLKK